MHIWEDNIRMNPEEIGIDVRDWIDLVQDSDYWRALDWTSGFYKL